MSKLFTYGESKNQMIGQKNQVYYHKLNLHTRKATTPQMLSLSLTPHCRFALKLLSTHVVVSLISQRLLIQLTEKRYMGS